MTSSKNQTTADDQEENWMERTFGDSTDVDESLTVTRTDMVKAYPSFLLDRLRNGDVVERVLIVAELAVFALAIAVLVMGVIHVLG